MTDITAVFEIPYSTSDDTIDSVGDTMQSLAERLDLLLGESGKHAFGALVANASKTETQALSRVYPDGATVVCSWHADSGIINPATIELWQTDVAAGGNSFDVSCKATTNIAAGGRVVSYVVKPKAP